MAETTERQADDLLMEMSMLSTAQQVHVLAKAMAKVLYKSMQGEKLPLTALQLSKEMAMSLVSLYLDVEVRNG